MQRSKYINISLHILIWSVLLLLPYFITHSSSDVKVGSWPGVFLTISDLIHIVIFYGNALYLYPTYYKKHRRWKYIIYSLLLLFASVRLKLLIITVWFPYLMKDNSVYKLIAIPSVIIFIISIIYRKVVDGIRLERLQKEMQAAQLETELKFLRSQISPHFLFNVLTNLVSLARKGSPRLEASLITLADLMRYMLYDAQGKKVELSKEISYLHSYIELQRLRFGSDIDIQCHIGTNPGDDDLIIEPMLLIPFVENAFKHGTAPAGEQLRILIDLSVKDRSLIFDVQNNFDPEQQIGEDEHSGIGLNNVKTRLGMLYKDKYTLSVNDRDRLFHITLNLKLT